MMLIRRLRNAYEDGRALAKDVAYALRKLREDWAERSELEETELQTVRFHRSRRALGEWLGENAKRLEVKVPPSNAATKSLLATLRAGDRVKLSNGEVRTVLEAPRVINGWEMVKTTPHASPRASREDPPFSYWPLVQIAGVVVDTLDDPPPPDDDDDNADDDDDDPGPPLRTELVQLARDFGAAVRPRDYVHEVLDHHLKREAERQAIRQQCLQVVVLTQQLAANAYARARDFGEATEAERCSQQQLAAVYSEMARNLYDDVKDVLNR